MYSILKKKLLNSNISLLKTFKKKRILSKETANIYNMVWHNLQDIRATFTAFV